MLLFTSEPVQYIADLVSMICRQITSSDKVELDFLGDILD